MELHFERRQTPRPPLPTSTLRAEVSGPEVVITFHSLTAHFTTFMTPEDLREAWESFGVVLQAMEVPA